MINIVSMTSPVMSSEAHWGKTEITHDHAEILQYLQDPACFTEDEIFHDDQGNNYGIDELIGVKIQVGETILEVHE